MKNRLYLLFLIIAQSLCAQITFVIDELPANHDYDKDIYISGNFEGWSGGHEDYKLEKIDKSYSITLPITQETILYKFTMGSWATVERDAEGEQTDNRIYKHTQLKDTISIKIVSWDEINNSEGKSTAAKNVSVLSEDFKIPELDRTRRISMYLPPDYHDSNESYPVVYLQDGQNVFDVHTSYAGEWEIDEKLNKLFKLYNFRLIVVAIDNGREKRLNEYSPWENKKYGKPEGEAYVNFIANNLKPYIDSNFRTLSDSKHTGIMGSSMGGLISHYAALKHPNVFGKAGVFSPSFWYSNESYDFTAQQVNNSKDLKMYYLVGGKEGDSMESDMIKMIELMKSNGFNQNNIKQQIVEDGMHNEKFWISEFEEAILWLFPEAIKKREFISFEEKSNYFEIKVNDGSYRIHPYSDKIVETSFIPLGEQYSAESHAVVLKGDLTNTISREEENNIHISTKGIEVNIQKEPFNISYWYKGKEVTSERNGYRKKDSLETIQFNLNPDEILYGGGARALGMNRRGNRLELYNKAHYGYETESKLMNYTLPIVLSSSQYMIHFDNAPIGFLDLDSQQDNTLTYETISGRKTYQVIVGDSWLDLIDNYTDLTGKQPLPPRWILGNFSSRFGYHSQKEVEETVQKFDDESIPLDAVIIDIYWFGKDIQGHMGNLEFLRDSFPNPKHMIKSLSSKGVKTVLVTEPFILTTSNRWEEAVREDILAKDSKGEPFTYDFYFGNTGLIDVYSQKGKSWFWNVYKDLANLGVKGVWGDLGEPEVHPSDLIHATGTADEVHNTYGHDWARLVYEGYQKDFPNQRPFILMRSGSSGSQRFGLVPWSGDVNRTWGGLQSQTEIAIQMAMQGLGYMHSDLGGFAGANLDDELYTRWLQYGVFQPIYRPHAQEEVPAEPVFREEKTKQLAKESIELRYKLLPYNYTLAFDNNQSGAPLMRPIFFDEPNDKNHLVNASTYLWGEDILVTPIVNPGVQNKDVYFPKDNVWFDFYTDEKYDGGQTQNVTTYENSIPTYVRAGAFIPMAKLVQSTDDYTASDLNLHYYYSESIIESDGQLYHDDGLTPNAYEKGEYELLQFESEVDKKNIEIELDAETGVLFKTKKKQINVIVHNIQNKPKRVKIDGKKIGFEWKELNKTLHIPCNWNTLNEMEIKIKLNK